eukprot:767545-Hanusia_phi.AAC.2
MIESNTRSKVSPEVSARAHFGFDLFSTTRYFCHGKLTPVMTTRSLTTVVWIESDSVHPPRVSAGKEAHLIGAWLSYLNPVLAASTVPLALSPCEIPGSVPVYNYDSRLSHCARYPHAERSCRNTFVPLEFK